MKIEWPEGVTERSCVGKSVVVETHLLERSKPSFQIVYEFEPINDLLR